MAISDSDTHILAVLADGQFQFGFAAIERHFLSETFTALGDQLLEHVQSLPDREEVLGMDDAQIEALLDNIMQLVPDVP